MDQNISNSILQSSESFPSNVYTNNSFIDTTSYIDTIRNISMIQWLLIVIILAFLGINIFVYLAKGTQDITSFLKPIVDKFAALFGGVTSQIIDVSAEGAKGVVNTTATVADKGLSAVQDITSGSNISSTSVQSTIPQPDIMQANTLNRALNTSNQVFNDYEADDSSSNIQNGAPKAGWCFIGEDRGFRSCAKIGVNDTCMSGDIFPSHEICVNPSLRA
jgi:hypothetical protein